MIICALAALLPAYFAARLELPVEAVEPFDLLSEKISFERVTEGDGAN